MQTYLTEANSVHRRGWPAVLGVDPVTAVTIFATTYMAQSSGTDDDSSKRIVTYICMHAWQWQRQWQQGEDSDKHVKSVITHWCNSTDAANLASVCLQTTWTRPWTSWIRRCQGTLLPAWRRTSPTSRTRSVDRWTRSLHTPRISHLGLLPYSHALARRYLNGSHFTAVQCNTLTEKS